MDVTKKVDATSEKQFETDTDTFWKTMLEDEEPELTMGSVEIYEIGCMGKTYYALFAHSSDDNYHAVGWKEEHGGKASGATLQDAVNIVLANGLHDHKNILFYYGD